MPFKGACPTAKIQMSHKVEARGRQWDFLQILAYLLENTEVEHKQT